MRMDEVENIIEGDKKLHRGGLIRPITSVLIFVVIIILSVAAINNLNNEINGLKSENKKLHEEAEFQKDKADHIIGYVETIIINSDKLQKNEFSTDAERITALAFYNAAKKDFQKYVGEE